MSLRDQGVAGSNPQLDPSDPRAKRATDYVERLLGAMPCPREPNGFHAELFEHAARGILLCEIACRAGGGRIRDIARLTLGVDLDRWAALGQAGSDPARLLPAPRRSMRLMGDVLFPNPGRTLLRAPERSPLPQVVDFKIGAKSGEFAPRATKVSEEAADVLFVADDRPALEETYRRVVEWIESEMTWVDP